MSKDKTLIIFIILLMAVIVIAISVVVSVYNKNKPIVPNNTIELISTNDMLKIKTAYEAEGKKQEFLDLYGKIELATANKLLDGTVTNDEELAEAINKINAVLLTNDWSYLGIEASNYWMGSWQLDSSGVVKFVFTEKEIEPSWVMDSDVKEIIIDIK